MAEAVPAVPGPAPAEEGRGGWIGVVVAGESVEVSPNIQGRVAEVAVDVGDPVRRGQILLRMDPTALEQDLKMAEAGLRAARAEHERLEIEKSEAEVRYRRRTDLAELVSEEEVSESRLAFERANAAVRVADARVSETEARVEQLREYLRQTEVRAPFDGTVTLRRADAGAVAGPSQPVLSVSSGSLRVRFAVPPAERDDLRQGQRLWAECCGSTMTTPVVIERIAPQIDLASQMVIVEATFPDSTAVPFRNGQDVEVAPLAPEG